MPMLAYTVSATFPDRALADEYVRWLAEGHVAAVIAAGALDGRIVRITEPAEPPCVETRYTFADRQAFDRYLAGAATELRADGLRRFGPERGVVMSRSVGDVVEPAREAGGVR